MMDMALNDVITLGMCFLMFVYIHACLYFVLIGGNLTVDGEPQGNWMRNSNSETRLQALLPFPTLSPDRHS